MIRIALPVDLPIPGLSRAAADLVAGGTYQPERSHLPADYHLAQFTAGRP